MVALPLSPELLALAIVALGLAIVGTGAYLLCARHRDASAGTLVAIDAGAPTTLRSERYRLVGRPDVLRRLPDGRVVPIEVKSRVTPARGPPRSHLVQVWSYCLLAEETTGTAPPYGFLRYSDGGSFRVPWDRSARSELLALRAAIDQPYHGEATPSTGKCARCRWTAVCDATAARS